MKKGPVTSDEASLLPIQRLKLTALDAEAQSLHLAITTFLDATRAKPSAALIALEQIVAQTIVSICAANRYGEDDLFAILRAHDANVKNYVGQMVTVIPKAGPLPPKQE